MIDLFAEASAIAKNMIGKYLEAAPDMRDEMPGASIARSAWDRTQDELKRVGMGEFAEALTTNPGSIPSELPRAMTKLMSNNDEFAGELRQLYDNFLRESTSQINVSQKVDNISGGGKVVGISIASTTLGSITGDIVTSETKPPTDPDADQG